MNSLDRFAQMLIAAIFLFAGLSKIFALRRRTQTQAAPSWSGKGLSRRTVCAIAWMEIAGALGLVVPLDLWQPNMLPSLAAGELALLTLAVSIYHVRHKEPAAPMFALFFLSLLVIVGRWM
jgi:DoxX-like protein